MVEICTTKTTWTVTSDGSQSITIDSDAEVLFVAVFGWNGYSDASLLCDELNFDDGGTVDFTELETSYYTANNTSQCAVYYMTDQDINWPGTGSKTIYHGTIGYNEGYRYYAWACKNVDTSNLIIGKDVRVAGGNWTSGSLGTVTANDMSFVVAYGYNETPDPDPSGSGQTELASYSAYMGAGAGIGYKLNDATMEVDGTDICPIAFAIKFKSVVSGSTTWGHSTGVAENNTRVLSGNWTGTGSISGSGDSESMRIDPGESMESEVVNIGANTVVIEVDKYNTGVGPPPTIEYKDGNSEANCNADTWNAYSSSFVSTGYVKIKISVDGVTLVVADSAHVLTNDAIVLAHKQSITVNESAHVLTNDAIVLEVGGTLLLGDDTVMTNEKTSNNDGYAVYYISQSLAAGTSPVTLYARMKGSFSSVSVKGCIWNGSTGALIASSSPVTVGDSEELAEFSIATSISSSTDYCYGYISDGYTSVWHDGQTYKCGYESNNYTSPGTLSNLSKPPGDGEGGVPEIYVKD